MTTNSWVRSHVERLLQEEWDVCRVTKDDDGDYHYRRGTAACWVSIMETDDVPFIRVFAHAARLPKPSLAMFRELNDIQVRCSTASVMWCCGPVTVSQTISPIGLTAPVLTQAMNAVAGVADDIGLLLAATFNGATPYPAEAPESEDAA